MRWRARGRSRPPMRGRCCEGAPRTRGCAAALLTALLPCCRCAEDVRLWHALASGRYQNQPEGPPKLTQAATAAVSLAVAALTT